MPPSTASRRRPSARSARWRSAAATDVGFAFQASFTTKPPPGNGSSSPRQREIRDIGGALRGALERQAERLVRVECSQRVLRLVRPRSGKWMRRSRKATVTPRSSGSAVDRGTRRTSRSARRYGSSSADSGTIAGAPAGSASSSSAFDAGDPVDRPDAFEVHRADRGDHRSVGAGEAAQLGDLAEPAHAHLDEAELRVGLEAAERERDAELGVEARLGRDRPGDGGAERGEDVLRRGLPGRAGDADDAGRAAVAHGSRDCGEGGEGVVGHERRGRARRARVVEELARRRRPRRRDRRSWMRRESICIPVTEPCACELPGRELADLLDVERDHARSASRTTSRSSNGSFSGPIS